MKNCFIAGMFLLLTGPGTIKISAQTALTRNMKLSEHPRLFFSQGEEAGILERAKTNVLLAQMITALGKEADKTLAAAPQRYEPDTELLATSREEIKRIVDLSMAYRLFKDEKYARKTEEELLNVCRYPSWNPKHFLDVAEMATAVSIGYDWCYDYLSASSRNIIEKALRENAWAPSWPLYNNADKGKQTPFSRENNWNMVCNSGLVSSAIVLADKYPAEANRIITAAIKYTPNLLKSFAPEGVYNEGPGYWDYNAMYMVLFFDNLQRNVGNDFGLPAYKGISNTAAFYTNLIGPSGQTFNFGDAGTRIDNSETFFYLSRHYHQPEVAASYRRLIQSLLTSYNNGEEVSFARYFFLAIPWFDDATPDQQEETSKLQVFQGMTDFLFFNGDNRANPNRLYLAAKTGRPEWSHNHLDVGSFVLDCDGQRWAADLGPDKYSLPKFWDYEPGGQRWKYFRNTNLAHNTLNIDGRITSSDGQGELIRFDQQAAQPFGIFDLTAAYTGQASSVQRGFRLLSPDLMLIRDEIIPAPAASTVSWRFLTSAAVTINGNMATLTQNGKQFYIKCLANNGYTLTVFPAKPFTSAEKSIDDVNIIEITVKTAGKPVVIPVLMGNHATDMNAGAISGTALQTWK